MNRRKMPIESHVTAAWAGIKKRKEHSKVPLPSEEEILQAKDYVDQNEK